MGRGRSGMLLGESFDALSLTINPSPASGTFPGSGTASAAVSAVPVGGSGSFLYSWSSANLAISTPSAATTLLSAFVNDSQTVTYTATCVVTDVRTGRTAQASVNVTLTGVHQVTTHITPFAANTVSAGPNAGPFTQDFSSSGLGGAGVAWAWSIRNDPYSNAQIIGVSGPTCTCQWRNTSYTTGPYNAVATLTCVTTANNGFTYSASATINMGWRPP